MEFKTVTIFKQAAHYTGAVLEHVATGSHTRTDAEVEALFATCQACEHFDPVGRCALCGCRLSIGKKALFNKLRMASQKCPEGKW